MTRFSLWETHAAFDKSVYCSISKITEAIYKDSRLVNDYNTLANNKNRSGFHDTVLFIDLERAGRPD